MPGLRLDTRRRATTPAIVNRMPAPPTGEDERARLAAEERKILHRQDQPNRARARRRSSRRSARGSDRRDGIPCRLGNRGRVVRRIRGMSGDVRVSHWAPPSSQPAGPARSARRRRWRRRRCEQRVGQRDRSGPRSIDGSVSSFGSRKKTTGHSAVSCGPSRCSLKQKHWTLSNQAPESSGVTLKTAWRRLPGRCGSRRERTPSPTCRRAGGPPRSRARSARQPRRDIGVERDPQRALAARRPPATRCGVPS